MTNKEWDDLAIPPFLRVFTMNGAMLDKIIKALDKHELVNELVKMRDGWPNRKPTVHPVEDDKVVAAGPLKVRFTGKMKEAVGSQIIRAVSDGCNTFAKLKKEITVLRQNGSDYPMPTNVLQSALKHAIKHRRVVKLSPKTYGLPD